MDQFSYFGTLTIALTIMRHYFPLLLLSLLAFQLPAQQATTIPGEVLLLLPNETGPGNLLVDLREINGRESGLAPIRKLAPGLNIWHFQFREDQVSLDAVLAALRAHPDVDIAQANHKIESRLTTPNDPSFGSQWQYVNSGAGGGVADADIDADEAWDVTTGGTTPLGEEIVVAVIDDGIELNHPDFAGNLWVNSGEIPNNNIDDDNNGYVDDHRGWNAYDNNDNVEHSPFEDHGTPVAGIVGARGNNGIGVSGVNWEVKMMIVKGGGGEADALAAYGYVLAVRKQWNASNGSEGAFVVASNASWGTDFGQAADAPLWCAMYDSLGQAGVLNVGATANNNVNVDNVGDLPSVCPSNYLIAVTNMKRDDTKETFAGFGSTHIDLGAPGEDVFTVAKGSTYAGFGGTSGAAPHVAGAIALLYAGPCNKLAQTAIDQPAAAALAVRDFILDGGDANNDLAGITVTGNRLNLSGAMNELTTNCNSVSTPEYAVNQTVWGFYPNPSGENIYLNIDPNSVVGGQIRITDVLGRTQSFPLKNGLDRNGLNVSQFASGWYLIQLVQADGTPVGEAQKLVIQK
ncbi:MAG: S8 family serine peptidase [Salibacteraceae bacterium]